MGILWSSASQPGYIDGLKFPSNIKRDFNINDSAVKVEQLLRASINYYRLSGIAAPLTAAFYLGASPQQLTALYEKWVPLLCEVWPEDDPVGDSIGEFNLDEFYGEPRYEQRYYEYFRDCLTEEKGWEEVAIHHMDQLWTRLSRNNMRPIIEMAAGIEMDNAMIVAEALAMSCTDPEGDVPAVNSNPDTTATQDLSPRFRNLARLALKSGTYESVVGLHACAEIFFRPGTHIVDEKRELAILDALESYIITIGMNETGRRMKTMEPHEALASEDPHEITYTRSRLVLKYLAT